jgi:hypothetical protein
MDIFPSKGGVSLKHGPGKRLLDGNPILSTLAIVEAADEVWVPCQVARGSLD